MSLALGIQAQADSPAPGLASYVNPFVGTEANGDTYPGAQVPFGMVQLNPDLRGQGYYYNEPSMHGFALTLMSGPGGSNNGTPFFTATTGPVQVDPADYSYTYDHKDEAASAGYYRALMQPSGIQAELTATTRCGLARFTFPAGKPANVLLPISYANVPVSPSQVDKVDDQTLTGQTSSKPFYGPAKPIVIYFAMKFDRPFTAHGSWTGEQVTANSDHVTQPDEKTPVGFYVSYPAPSAPFVLNVRIGISYVSVAGALANLQAEVPDANFDAYRAQATAAWNLELGRIEVQDTSELHKRIFYTALYHALLFPSIFDDADGHYRGYDDVVRQVPAGHHHIYANYSGWDIYRSEWPLLTLIEPERAQDMAQSIVEMYRQLGYIDRWPEANRPTAIMNGNPLTICLANIWNAGLRNFDVATAYEAMLKAATPKGVEHVGAYEPLEKEDHGGFWPSTDSNVSTMQEYDVSFAALGHLALSLHKPDDADFLFGRAEEYRTLFNPETGFLQARDGEGRWVDPDDSENYCEGNKWIYRWFVPQDVQGLVDLLGGSDAFEQKLDEFFADHHYDPTNEPDLQAPYLYDYINRPWKTQKIVAETADHVFHDTPSGLAGGGNDDLGTMSAWYVLSQLGFYPVDPGVPYFETCTPRFTRAVLHLGEGTDAKTFTISAPAAAPEAIYIQSAELNGVALTKPWFAEKEILSGGEWNVTVGSQPNENWGASPFDRPYSLSTGFEYVPPDARMTSLLASGPKGGALWRSTTSRPAADWMQPGFADTSWKESAGGFGTEDVGVKPRTNWSSDDIWMRTTFNLKTIPTRAVLSVYHDADADMYLNGQLLAHLSGWVHGYVRVQVFAPDSPAAGLREGRNILALHVSHPGEGRHFADARLEEETLPPGR